ncbi:Mov34/MPN/PAD-1 family protein [Fontibacter flavus]|uniref:Mov34/MPN/PAD-1 family protein n=1 Tax=Fontibacter flavus TaxID=654838 RepID=A0ABV6FRQ9_9BACT
MIIFKKSILKQIIEVVEKVPEECCGFLFGTTTENTKTTSAFLPVQNVSKGNKVFRYEISSSDFLKAENYAMNNELEVLGVYHTHINATALPSGTDRSLAFPGLSYFIISLMNQKFSDIKSWKLNNNSIFEEEKIKLSNL